MLTTSVAPVKLYLKYHETLDENFDLFREIWFKQKRTKKTIEYFKLLYGEEKYEKKWIAYNRKIQYNPFTLKYWIDKGYSDEHAVIRLEEFKENRKTNKKNYIKKYGEVEGSIKHKEYCLKSVQNLDAFVKRFGDKGKEEYEKYLVNKDSMTFDWALKKANGNIEEAEIIHKKRKDDVVRSYVNWTKKWKEKGFSDEEIKEKIEKISIAKSINFEWALRKTNGNISDAIKLYSNLLHKRLHPKFGFTSGMSLKFLSTLNFLIDYGKIFYGTYNKEYFLYDTFFKRSYSYDFCFLHNNFDFKFIIEYNGEKWHPNYEKYTEEELIEKYNSAFNFKTEDEILNKILYDKRKIQLAKDYGYEVLILWSSDSDRDNFEKIKTFLKEKNIQYENKEDNKRKK